MKVSEGTQTLLNTAEAAKLLGYAPQTLRDMKYRKRVPAHCYIEMPGSFPKWIKEELLKWVDSFKTQAPEQPDQAAAEASA
jgi:hypothetical protein